MLRRCNGEAIECIRRSFFWLLAGCVATAQTGTTHAVNGTAAQSGAGANRALRRSRRFGLRMRATKAGINFTHSFGSAKLGSLLEGTGAGCIWFD